MKIGIDCRIFSSNFTGIGRYTHELVNHFIEFNSKLDKPHQLVLFFNSPEYHDFQTLAPVKKILVNAKHYSLKEQLTFYFKLKKEGCDIVHFPHFNVPILYRKPYIVTIHDLTLSFFPGRKMIKWYQRLAYHMTIRNSVKTAKKIVAVSKNTKYDIIDHLGVAKDKVTVIYNGLNPEFRIIRETEKFKPTLKKHNISKQFLLYTGVWRNHKNLPRLIEAFNILKKEKNLDLQLVITGKPDPHYPEVKNTVKKLEMEDDIIFTNLVPEKELVHLYNAALIFIFPSLYEGFGLPPLESMACGTPVVASKRSSIPEVCGQDNAIFFDPENVRDIAEKIWLLYKDADLQAELIEKGKLHSNDYSWAKTARETFNLIQNV